MRLRLPAPTSKKIGSGSRAALKVAAPAAPAPDYATLPLSVLNTTVCTAQYVQYKENSVNKYSICSTDITS